MEYVIEEWHFSSPNYLEANFEMFYSICETIQYVYLCWL